MKESQSIASVVIPTWNAAPFVERVVQALFAQEQVQIEVIVVDNGVVNADTKNMVDALRRQAPAHVELRYLEFAKQLGYAGAVNEGVKAAQYRFVVIMNNDNLPAPRCVAALLRAQRELSMLTGPTPALICANVTRPGVPSSVYGTMNFCSRVIYFPAEPITATYVPVFHPDGSAFLLDKNCIPLPYDEEYFIYHEDVAVGWQARLLGYGVWQARDAHVESFDGGSTRRIPYRTAYYTERNRWINQLCLLELRTLVKLLPLYLFDVFVTIAIGQNRKAKLHAWKWIFSNLGWLLANRREWQQKRRVGDDLVLSSISASYWVRRADHWLNKITRIYSTLLRLPFRA
jgi:GT2 family glycosyltransferase